MTRRVYLHIGAPKTGTTYLQDRLMLNATTLAEQGIVFPGGSRFVDADLFHFRAALDLLGQDWGGPSGHADGAWDSMVRKVRRASGSAIISHEILAPAAPDRIARVMRDLEDREVHIVYSARDLGRQLPAAWQESIKQGRKWTFRRFLARVEKGETWFRAAFDLPAVLTTWGANLPPDRIHLVTVPQRRGRKNLLWARFCTAFGIDPAWAPEESTRANRSMGIAETQLIRHLNKRLEITPRNSDYDHLVRQLLAEGALANRDSVPVRLGPGRREWCDEQTERWIEWVEGSGIDVIGNVADLRSTWPDPEEKWHNPDKLRPRMQLDAALDALALMTSEAAGRPDRDRNLTSRLRSNARRLGL